MRKILAAALVLFALVSKAQITVNGNITPLQGLENMLGPGVVATNITYSGEPNQIGLFEYTGSNFGMSSGFIMSSGTVDCAIGPNNSGGLSTFSPLDGVTDVDLDLLDPDNGHNNAVVLEFDFVATGDTVTFEYIWASEEYPEWANSGFNDVFGFFLSGPGINGTFSNNAINIALIPNTTNYVSINNINNGNADAGPCENCEYYVSNGNGDLSPNNTDASYIQFDGFTTVLVAVAEMQCGETYHIKLAVADAGDGALESAVFIEEGSFSSDGAVDISITNPPFPGWPSNHLAEGCIYGSFEVFQDDPNTADTLQLWYTGTASNGVDYSTLPEEVIIPAGAMSTLVDVEAFNDGFGEGDETIQIHYEFVNECGYVDTANAEIIIREQTPLVLQMSNVAWCPEAPITAVANPSGGFEPYNYVWDGGELTQTIQVTELGTYTVSITDFCGQTTQASFESIELLPQANITAEEIFVCPTVNATATGSASSGTSPYQYAWSNNGSTNTQASYGAQDLGVQYLIVTDACGFSDIDSVVVTLTEVLPEIDIAEDDLFVCPNGAEIANSTAFGGTPPYSYSWTGATSNSSTATFNFDDAGYQFVIVTDHCGYTATDSLLIEVPTPIVPRDDFYICVGESTGEIVSGGTYPYAYDFDSTAFSFDPGVILTNNGTLGFFEVEITDACGQVGDVVVEVKICDIFIPNIITPDGDGKNDSFEVLGGDDFPGSKMTIYNRWGTEVFHDEDYHKQWTAKENAAGTYYYVFERNDGKKYAGYVMVVKK